MALKHNGKLIFDWLKTNKTLKFIYVITVGILILTVFKFNGSSVGTYNQYFYGDIFGGDLIAGAPRPIRSDEWMVATPLLVSQSENNFDQENKFVGNGEDTAVIYDAPNKHWSTFFKPHNWGFFVAPLENAFAFKWGFRGGLLVVSTYLLLLILTKRNYWLSIIGGFLMFFTPMVQWWYAIQIMEPIAYGMLTTYFAIRLIQYESRKRLILYSFGIIFSGVSFALAFYPAFQVPIIYVAVLLFLGYFFNNKKEILSDNFRNKIIALSLSLIATIVIVGAYFYSVKETVSTILNTSYPGGRFINGGEYSPLHFLSSSYNFLLQFYAKDVPNIFGNQTEAASFLSIGLTIILLPLICYAIYRDFKSKKIDYIVFFLTIYFGICLIWLFIGFPVFLAKYSLFYLVPQNRLIIGMGVGSLILLILFSQKIQDFKLSKRNSLIYSALAFVFTAIIGNRLYHAFPNYIKSYYVILFVGVIIGAIVYFLLQKKSRIWIGILLAFAIFSTAIVNPIYFGLSPLYNGKVGNELKTFNSEKNTDKSKWIAFGGPYLGNFLIAQGIPTLNGTHLYPQLEIWKKFDSEEKFLVNYNRYSHILFVAANNEEVVFNNPVPDTLSITINPCNYRFQMFDLRYLISEKSLEEYSCLTLLKSTENPKLFLYGFNRID